MFEIRKKSNGKKELVRERATKKSSTGAQPHKYEYTPRDRYSRADSRDGHREEYRDYYDDHRDHRERQDYYPRFSPQPAFTPQFPPQPVPTFVATEPRVVYPQQGYKVRIQEPSYLRRSPSPPRGNPDGYYYERSHDAPSPRRDGFRSSSRSRSRSVYREEERGRKSYRPEEDPNDSWRNQYKKKHPPTESEEEDHHREFMRDVRAGRTIPPAPEAADFMKKPRGDKEKKYRRR